MTVQVRLKQADSAERVRELFANSEERVCGRTVGICENDRWPARWSPALTGKANTAPCDRPDSRSIMRVCVAGAESTN
jgi:hypothetical protein